MLSVGLAAQNMQLLYMKRNHFCACGSKKRPLANRCLSCAKLERTENAYSLERIGERFWPKVEKTESCWLWTGYVNAAGYGLVSARGGQILVHRMVLELQGVEVPEDKLVLHTCDVKICVNPGHLYIGTHLENMRDMWERNRVNLYLRSGENHGNAKFTDQQVAEMRQRYGTEVKRYTRKGMTSSMLANEYGISRAHLLKIVRGGARTRAPE
jgi:hypothetical protein